MPRIDGVPKGVELKASEMSLLKCFGGKKHCRKRHETHVVCRTDVRSTVYLLWVASVGEKDIYSSRQQVKLTILYPPINWRRKGVLFLYSRLEWKRRRIVIRDSLFVYQWVPHSSRLNSSYGCQNETGGSAGFLRSNYMSIAGYVLEAT